MLAYLDSMTKNDDFLVHLGNAMRGSLLAGKPYPTRRPGPLARRPTPAPDRADDRLDKVLFALHQLQGQVADLLMTLDEMRDGRREAPRPSRQTGADRRAPSGHAPPEATRRTKTASRAPSARRPKARKRKGRA